MEFRIANTFTDSLSKLTGQEQKAAKTTAFDLQMDPANPGMQFHRIERAKDPNFWSVRVNRDIRLIVHKSSSSLLLCYVGHHDDAYKWAQRRKLERHPRTGAAQLVEIRKRVEEITIPVYVEVEQPASPKPPLFEHLDEDRLLNYGVPAEWLADVRAATEDTILDLADHLPAEAAEALLEIATGGIPEPISGVPAEIDPFDHPDAQRRFRVMRNVEELEQALEYPWEKWTVFLHPVQRELVERNYNGPARVSGSAGTGKTVVALHRAVYLARQHPNARVLLTTFSEALARALHIKLKRLIGSEPRLGERIDIHAINAIGNRLYAFHFGRAKLALDEIVNQLLLDASATIEDHRYTPVFLRAEWYNVVDAWQLHSWEQYRDVRRLGRKTRLPESQRVILWKLFERVRSALNDRDLLTQAEVFSQITQKIETLSHPPFDFAVVDEAQDISVPQLRFLAALGGNRPNSLFFAGDLGQRIFQQPFSWKSLGVDIRGRSRTLRICYRTSHQIRRQADLLLGPEVSDVDGNIESRRGTVSVFNGPPPVINVLESPEAEIEFVSQWLADRESEGLTPHEIGLFVRSVNEIERAHASVEMAGLSYAVLDEHVETTTGHISISTMHLAKGLEFRAVVVMACDDEVIPLQNRIEAIADEADLEEVYNTERHLLYVACTRARDQLLVTGVEPGSEFLDDLLMA